MTKNTQKKWHGKSDARQLIWFNKASYYTQRNYFEYTVYKHVQGMDMLLALAFYMEAS